MPRCSSGIIIVTSVVSCPPWVEAVQVNTPAGLPSISPLSQRLAGNQRLKRAIVCICKRLINRILRMPYFLLLHLLLKSSNYQPSRTLGQIRHGASTANRVSLFQNAIFASGSDSGPECSDSLFAAPLAAAYRAQPIGEASSTVTRVVTDAAAHCPGTADLVRRTIPMRACLRLVSLYFPQSNARKPACTAKPRCAANQYHVRLPIGTYRRARSLPSLGALSLKCPGPSLFDFLSNRKECRRMFPRIRSLGNRLKWPVFTAEETGSYSLSHFLVLLVSPD